MASNKMKYNKIYVSIQYYRRRRRRRKKSHIVQSI
jgi:hypothetical protein